jgi:hypothetical protein
MPAMPGRMREYWLTAVALLAAIVGAALTTMGLESVWFLKHADRSTLLVNFLIFLVAMAVLIVEREVKLRRLTTAKVKLVFDATDSSIYVQRGDVIAKGYGYDEYKYHLGVINTSGVTLQRLRLVLHEARPELPHFVYLGNPMTVRGEIADGGHFDLPPTDGHSPSRYVELFQELVPKAGGNVEARLPYAPGSTGTPKTFNDKKKRVFTFRLEGGGLSEARFFLAEIAFDSTRNRFRVLEV